MEREVANGMYPIRRITPAEWAAYCDKDRWDVMTALRGPDTPNIILKTYTTAIIRGVVASTLRTDTTSAMVIPEPRIIVLPDHTTARVNEFEVRHFLGHIQDAAEVLRLKVAFIGGDLWWRVIMSPTGPQFGKVQIFAGQLDTIAYNSFMAQHYRSPF